MMKDVTVAAVLRNHQWRAALIVDNQFKDAVIADTITELLLDTISPLMVGLALGEGTEVAVNLTVRQPTREVPGGQAAS
jgi:hypothetical protein